MSFIVMTSKKKLCNESSPKIMLRNFFSLTKNNTHYHKLVSTVNQEGG
jgi:hypothetical protein